jgi:hypothetical protein
MGLSTMSSKPIVSANPSLLVDKENFLHSNKSNSVASPHQLSAQLAHLGKNWKPVGVFNTTMTIDKKTEKWRFRFKFG